MEKRLKNICIILSLFCTSIIFFMFFLGFVFNYQNNVISDKVIKKEVCVLILSKKFIRSHNLATSDSYIVNINCNKINYLLDSKDLFSKTNEGDKLQMTLMNRYNKNGHVLSSNLLINHNTFKIKKG